MERYDAAVIGAGPDGLIAAQRLARSGLSVIVLERAAQAGGRATTQEFFPGFRASPYADELAALPRRFHWTVEPARRGAVLMQSPASVCLSASGTSLFFADEPRLARATGEAAAGLIALRRALAVTREDIARRTVSVGVSRRARLFRRDGRSPWPGEAWMQISLDEALCARIPDEQARVHLAASSANGRAVSPFLAGTALHLLAAGSGTPPGGLGTLGAALEHAAKSAGAAVRLSSEVADIRVSAERVSGLVLAGGEEIAARAVLSTLDVKRTFLNLIAWKMLPEPLVKRVARFRMAGAAARVLFALDTVPSFGFARETPDAARGPIHVVDSLEQMSRACDAWRRGQLAERLPVTLRVPSLSDPFLAPAGKAVLTATLSCVPSLPFDSEWTTAKRGKLVAAALNAAEQASPGISASVLSAQTIVASDVESALGLTDGDFDGGEVAPDQIFGFRPFPDWPDGRTPLRGLYLGGPSSGAAPFLTGVAGERAALALVADLKGRAE